MAKIEYLPIKTSLNSSLKSVISFNYAQRQIGMIQVTTKNEFMSELF